MKADRDRPEAGLAMGLDVNGGFPWRSFSHCAKTSVVVAAWFEAITKAGSSYNK